MTNSPLSIAKNVIIIDGNIMDGDPLIVPAVNIVYREQNNYNTIAIAWTPPCLAIASHTIKRCCLATAATLANSCHSAIIEGTLYPIKF